MKLASFVVAVDALLICAAAATGDLHPIVEVQSGYLFEVFCRLPVHPGLTLGVGVACRQCDQCSD